MVAVYQEILEHPMLSSANKVYIDADLTLAPTKQYQDLVYLTWDHCAWLGSKLSSSEPHRNLMEDCQEKDEKHQSQEYRQLQSHH